MSLGIDDQAAAIAERAMGLMKRYGGPSKDPEDAAPGVLVAKLPAWRGFKIKFIPTGDGRSRVGRLRLRLLGELMLAARLDRGWEEDADRIADLRAKPGDWRERFMALR